MAFLFQHRNPLLLLLAAAAAVTQPTAPAVTQPTAAADVMQLGPAAVTKPAAVATLHPAAEPTAANYEDAASGEKDAATFKPMPMPVATRVLVQLAAAPLVPPAPLARTSTDAGIHSSCRVPTNDVPVLQSWFRNGQWTPYRKVSTLPRPKLLYIVTVQEPSQKRQRVD